MTPMTTPVGPIYRKPIGAVLRPGGGFSQVRSEIVEAARCSGGPAAWVWDNSPPSIQTAPAGPGVVGSLFGLALCRRL